MSLHIMQKLSTKSWICYLSTDLRETVNSGLEKVACRAPIIWTKLQSEYKFAIPLKILRWELKLRNETYVLAYYAKSFNQILNLSTKEYEIKISNCFFEKKKTLKISLKICFN